MAWVAYATEHDSQIVQGSVTSTRASIPGRRTIEGWVGAAFMFPESDAALHEDPEKGALWPYIRQVDAYRCPGGRAGHAVTYAPVAAANGVVVEGTYLPGTAEAELRVLGKRVGATVLRLTRLTDIVSPGASARAVFVDQGYTPAGLDYFVEYLRPLWRYTPPAIHHDAGMTLSMADGHAEYWKWKGRETVAGVPRKDVQIAGFYVGMLEEMEYQPETEDGLADLQRLQRATWGRLGYPPESPP